MRNRLPAYIAKPASGDDVADPLQAGGAVHATESAAEMEVLLDFHFRIERAIFGEIAQFLADGFGFMKDVESCNCCSTAGCRQIASEDAQSGRFARAVG